ncbi:Flagellin and related hook-associated protein FlgL [Chelatococcus sambhunathii]|uniref:Flagellin n=1 Tax=Chelatococcus sambhunathii TaxID=363953 RepID=A0ABP2A655_9HYPH|nr:flagellar hook-associated family protein [Chelatococcus sambhunathii]CUA85110.1 Flagellin and related hook-associated protein FlgL [Chelatococcus sambhunathii]
MKTTFISTYSLLNSPRSSLVRMQADAARYNQEIATGRHADVGLTLGGRTSQAVSLRAEYDNLTAMIDANSRTKTRLDVTVEALGNIREMADEFQAELLSVPHAQRGSEVIRNAARDKLAALIGSLNSAVDGQFLFGGTNSGVTPINDYAAGSASKVAVDAAFFAEFGFAQDDPAVANISAAAMATFLDNAFSDRFFVDANWQADWSNAADSVQRSRISQSETLTSSVSANEAALRQLAAAYTMVFDLGSDKLNTDALQVVIDKATELMGGAIAQIIDIEAQMGVAQNRIETANTNMEAQKKILATRVGKLEDVDPAEAKVRLDALLTQIEMSYSLTVRLQSLSLLRYL